MGLFKKKEKCIEDIELNELLLSTLRAYVAKAPSSPNRFSGLDAFRPAGCNRGAANEAASKEAASKEAASERPALRLAGGVYGAGYGGGTGFGNGSGFGSGAGFGNGTGDFVERAREGVSGGLHAMSEMVEMARAGVEAREGAGYGAAGCGMQQEEVRRPMTLEEFEALMLYGFPKSRATFADELCWYIDRLGVSNAYVFKRANVSSAVFSAIISKHQAMPSKNTALALAIALELTLKEAEGLLAKAGYEFSDRDVTDLVAAYCIEHRKTDVDEINRVLYEMGAELLGSEAYE